MIKLEVGIDSEVDDGETYCNINFRFMLNDQKIGSMEINEPLKCSIQQYTDMADGRSLKLVYCEWNGYTAIECDNDKLVTFTVSKFGEGGLMSFIMKHENCKAAFEEFAKWRASV
jgi:hypothetical protein